MRDPHNLFKHRNLWPPHWVLRNPHLPSNQRDLWRPIWMSETPAFSLRTQSHSLGRSTSPPSVGESPPLSCREALRDIPIHNVKPWWKCRNLKLINNQSCRLAILHIEPINYISDITSFYFNLLNLFLMNISKCNCTAILSHLYAKLEQNV